MFYPSIPSIDVIVGGQFGSEAKGHVTKRVIEKIVQFERPRGVVNVRVAGPNAGHCVLDAEGNKFALRTIPVGVVFENVYLFIAPGSEIDPTVLLNEIQTVREGGHEVTGRLFIHEEATLLTPDHIDQEAGMHERMGSTGKGIGAARAARIMRVAARVKDDFAFIDRMLDEGIVIIGDEGMSDLYHQQAVVIEGTQGYGLGLHAGFYPQCTSSDCRPVDFLSMAGLDPTFTGTYTPWVVARVYPIRVAGNSGPLQGETTWEDLGLPEEFTTVTKKVRRVGEWDAGLVNRAIAAAGPRARVALTMFDQKVPAIEGIHNRYTQAYPDEFTPSVRNVLYSYQEQLAASICLVTTGEDTGIWL